MGGQCGSAVYPRKRALARKRRQSSIPISLTISQHTIVRGWNRIAALTSYRGIEVADWFGHSPLQSQIVGYAITTSRIDSLNRMKTLNESFVFGKALILKQLTMLSCQSSESMREEKISHRFSRLCGASGEIRSFQSSFKSKLVHTFGAIVLMVIHLRCTQELRVRFSLVSGHIFVSPRLTTL